MIASLAVHEWLLLGPVALVLCFQLYYLVFSLRVRFAAAPAARPVNGAGPAACSILVPVMNSAATLERCLTSILANDLSLVDKVVVVLDRCTDSSERVARSFVSPFAERGSLLEVTALPPDRWGKVAGILYGVGRLRTETLLLLDGDIVLEPYAVRELVEHHRALGEPFTSCLIFPYQEGGRSTLRDHIIRNNRLYRQSVVQTVKNLFDVANFPGGVQMVEIGAYRKLLVDGFLEDLSATYGVLAAGGRVKILPRVLAYEIERETLTSLFLQRVRWTIGALQHLPIQVRTAARRRNLHEKLLVNSYHVMWELQHYVIVGAFLAAPFSPRLGWLFVSPLAVYALKVARSMYLSRGHYRNSLLGGLVHCLVFPAVISAALLGSFVLLLKERRFFFGSAVLYRRS